MEDSAFKKIIGGVILGFVALASYIYITTAKAQPRHSTQNNNILGKSVEEKPTHENKKSYPNAEPLQKQSFSPPNSPQQTPEKNSDEKPTLLDKVEKTLRKIAIAGHFPPPDEIENLKILVDEVSEKLGEEGVAHIRRLSSSLSSAVSEWIFYHSLRTNKKVTWNGKTGLMEGSNLMSQKEAAAAERIQSTFRRAYWDKHKEDLMNRPPEYQCVFARIVELRLRMCSFLPSKRQEAFASKLDLDFLKQQIMHNAFDRETFIDLLKVIVDMLYNLESPAQHSRTVQWFEEEILKAKGLGEYPSREESLQAFHNEIIDALEFLFSQCDILESELQNFRASQLSMNERRKLEVDQFVRLIEIGVMDISKTRELFESFLATVDGRLGAPPVTPEVLDSLASAASQAIQDDAVASSEEEGFPKDTISSQASRMSRWVTSKAATPLRQLVMNSIVAHFFPSLILNTHRLVVNTCEESDTPASRHKWEISLAARISSSLLIEPMRADAATILQLARNFGAIIQLAITVLAIHKLLPEMFLEKTELVAAMFNQIFAVYMADKSAISAAGRASSTPSTPESEIEGQEREWTQSGIRSKVVDCIVRACFDVDEATGKAVMKLTRTMESVLGILLCSGRMAEDCIQDPERQGQAVVTFCLLTQRAEHAIFEGLKKALVPSEQQKMYFSRTKNQPMSPRTSLSPDGRARVNARLNFPPPENVVQGEGNRQVSLVSKDAFGNGPWTMIFAVQKLDSFLREMIEFSCEHIHVYLPLYTEVVAELAMAKVNKERALRSHLNHLD